MVLLDMTHSISPEMPVFPTYPKPAIITWCKRQSFVFQSNVLFLSEHTGTHLDAPYHLIEEGKFVDQLDLKYMMREAVALTVGNTNGSIDAHRIEDACRKANVRIKNGDNVLLDTGWDSHWTRDDYVLSYPGLTEDAAKYLSDMNVSLVGVDTPNIDLPKAGSFPVHTRLLSKEVLIIENLHNIRRLSGKKFQFVALPLKLQGGTGSPVRAIAII